MGSRAIGESLVHRVFLAVEGVTVAAPIGYRTGESFQREGENLMADNRERDRMVFETSEVVKRAVRLRAAVEGVKPADVVNAGLRLYLAREIVNAREHIESERGKLSHGRKS
jgi:hypothetical protein